MGINRVGVVYLRCNLLPHSSQINDGDVGEERLLTEERIQCTLGCTGKPRSFGQCLPVTHHGPQWASMAKARPKWNKVGLFLLASFLASFGFVDPEQPADTPIII